MRTEIDIRNIRAYKISVRTEVKRTPWFDLAGYWACTAYFSDGTKATVLEHRELVEKKLGRKLRRGEVVHHKDHNRRNNELDNLELVHSRSAHAKLHADEHPPVMLRLVCVGCDTPFERRASEERHNRKGRAGPFCGKSCAGRYSRAKQLSEGKRNLRLG